MMQENTCTTLELVQPAPLPPADLARLNYEAFVTDPSAPVYADFYQTAPDDDEDEGEG